MFKPVYNFWTPEQNQDKMCSILEKKLLSSFWWVTGRENVYHKSNIKHAGERIGLHILIPSWDGKKTPKVRLCSENQQKTRNWGCGPCYGKSGQNVDENSWRRKSQLEMIGLSVYKSYFYYSTFFSGQLSSRRGVPKKGTGRKNKHSHSLLYSMKLTIYMPYIWERRNLFWIKINVLHNILDMALWISALWLWLVFSNDSRTII